MSKLLHFSFLFVIAGAADLVAETGVFEANGDVGVTPKGGRAEFDTASSEYRVTGGGENMWRDTDAFHFVWKRLSGDVVLTADVKFPAAGVAGHRKAAVMVRQSLEPGSAYADIAVHGDGLTSLQYRPQAGGQTLEMRSTLKGPSRIRIERIGDQFMMTAGNPGEPGQVIGPAGVVLRDPVYVGLAVCSHDANVLETAVFSNVKIENQPRRAVRSKVSVYDLRKKSVQVVHTADKVVEAPNWSLDGKYLLINSGGNLWRLASGGGAEPEKIDLGAIAGCNNDHGISPDGKRLAFSARGGAPGSRVYLAGIDGSEPRLMTPTSPSYFHGFSPDGRWLAFTGQRDGNFDLYRVAAEGGEEQRLTSNKGLDDGADYSRDGKWIYMNSDRTGNFDIWRIPADGAGPDDAKAQHVTSDGLEDWFPHPSPDGKWMVFVSFEQGTRGHPPYRNVQLRMMRMPGDTLKPARIQTLVKLFGGQGTINVNSWSPDSKKFAFVSYELVAPPR